MSWLGIYMICDSRQFKKTGLKTHDVIYAWSLICGGQHVDADEVHSRHRHRQDPVRQVKVCPHLDQGVDSV